MYRTSDQSPEAQAWRVEQMHANNAIEGIEKDEEIAALVAQWDSEGIPDEEQIKRLLELTKPKTFSMA